MYLDMQSIPLSRNGSLRHPAKKTVTALQWLAALLSLMTFSQILKAQNTPDGPGGVGVFDSTNAGVNFFQPVVAPVLVAPLGEHFLFESRFDLSAWLAKRSG
jgi:hypothetical protein